MKLVWSQSSSKKWELIKDENDNCDSDLHKLIIDIILTVILFVFYFMKTYDDFPMSGYFKVYKNKKARTLGYIA